MFAVGLDQKDISPSCMKFHGWWIFNLSSCHSHWVQKIQKEFGNELFFGKSPWDTLMKAYHISLFSPLNSLQAFAEDYHSFFKTKVSSSQIQKDFKHFYHLGIDKIGHLCKIPIPQIQRRFGKEWAEFFKGVLEPDSTPWKWQTHTPHKKLMSQLDPEHALCHAHQILEGVYAQLAQWSREKPSLFFNEIEMELISFDSEDDQRIHIEFPQRTSIQKDLHWVRKILEERLFHLQISSPVSEIKLSLNPSSPKESLQLSLFQDKSSEPKLIDLCEKLKSQGFTAFVPQSTPSLIPEKSWRKIEAKSHSSTISTAAYRPLIQFSPKSISKPEGRLFPTERLQWLEEDGALLKRDYYITRSHRKWVWIFRDQNGKWFEQGILE